MTSRRSFFRRSARAAAGVALAPLAGKAVAAPSPQLRQIPLKVRELPPLCVGLHPITGHKFGCMCLACDQVIDVEALMRQMLLETCTCGK